RRAAAGPTVRVSRGRASARVDAGRPDAFGLVVEVGGGVDEVVRAATHDGGVADLPDPLPPGRQASDEVTRAAGLGAGAQDWWRGSELHDGQRHLPQRGQGVQVTHLGRTCGDPVEDDHLTGWWKAFQEGVA